MPGALAGRRLVVVGGASGIGRSVALLGMVEGAGVAVLDRDPWQGSGTPALALRVDVTDRAAVDAGFTQAAMALSGLDGLVYCAGIDLLSTLEKTEDDAFTRLLDVNLTGAMRCCRALLPHMAKTGGSIVLLSSAAGLRPIPERSAYCASKAGLVMLAKSLAMELAARDIRVNAICPGAVDTPLFRSTLGGNETLTLEAIRNRYALGRIAEPEELARAAIFLTSAASSYITGTALAVDGGRSFH
jgi:NAD(P)-dependent dehydrogenase (short-subunit alcohol dehydrogenase family)